MRFGKNWKFKITPFRILLIIFVLIAAAAALYRFVYGLGAVTNLSDEWPWGLRIGFDLLCGIALVGGGFICADDGSIDPSDPLVRLAVLRILGR